MLFFHQRKIRTRIDCPLCGPPKFNFCLKFFTWVRQKFVESEPVEDVFDHFGQVGEEEDGVVGVRHDDGRCKQEAGSDLVVVLWPLGEQHL